MSESERNTAGDRASTLERECRALCRYLLAVDPSAYVVSRYLAAHRARTELVARTAFDRVILHAAVDTSLPIRIADAYARVFAPASLLRRKLVLLLAILESSPELSVELERVDRAPRPVLALRLVAQLAVWVAALAAGILLLVPRHALSRLRAGGGRETSPPRVGKRG